MSIQTCKILSTKELPQTVLADAAEKGILIECIPFISIRYRDTGAIAAELSLVHPSDRFIFTSKHAVAAVQPMLAAYENEAYCISGSTKEALEAFTRMRIAGTASTARLLCDHIRPDGGGSYIFCCGSERLDILPDHLTSQGIAFNEVICYDTVPLPRVLETIYDAILFFSPSAARSYFAWNKPYEYQQYYCIGATTADEVKKYSAHNLFVAAEPSVASLISRIHQTKQDERKLPRFKK